MAYTTIDDPSAHFQVKLYTGNSTNNTAITNDGNSNLQPDLIWAKSRSNTHYHDLRDSSRGIDERLVSNTTGVAATKDQSYVSFDSDGFTLGDDTDGSALNTVNTSSNNYVAWQWKCNGGTTSSNSSGSITSTVQANTTAGFSISTYTGNGTTGATIGHGLGVVPNWVMVKGRTVQNDWAIYHHRNTSAPETDVVNLQSTDGTSDSDTRWNDTAPTSTLVTFGNNAAVNANTYNYVAYCFAEKQGYSKFNSYTGNGNADGPFVYTGFKPAWVMWKRTDANGNSWGLVDHRRNKNDTQDVGNVIDVYLAADLDNDDSGNSDTMDFLSNGFKVRRTGNFINVDGSTYIYMAFAESPFVSSEGVPTTAR